MANHEFGTALMSRLNRTLPVAISGVIASPNAATTAIGTMARGAANTSGTKASCVGTVKPSGVSKRTRTERASTTVQTTAGATGNESASCRAHMPANAARNPAAETSVARSSRRDIPDAGRRMVSSSSSCSSRVGSIDMSRM